MTSLRKQDGFTVIELVLVVIIIGILSTIVLATYKGVQAKNDDSQRQIAINIIDTRVEAFFAQYGYYPTLADLQSASFRSTYMKGLHSDVLIDPKDGAIAAKASTKNYGYTATGSSDCVNTLRSDPTSTKTDNNGCTSFTLTADLQAGALYSKKSTT